MSKRDAMVAEWDAQVEINRIKKQQQKEEKRRQDIEDLIQEAVMGSIVSAKALEGMGIPRDSWEKAAATSSKEGPSSPKDIASAHIKVSSPSHQGGGGQGGGGHGKPMYGRRGQTPPHAATAAAAAPGGGERGAEEGVPSGGYDGVDPIAGGSERHNAINAIKRVARLQQLHHELRQDRVRFAAEEQALMVKRSAQKDGGGGEMRSDSQLVYSKWSDSIGRPSGEELAQGGMQGRHAEGMMGIDPRSASIDQLDMLLQSFLQSTRVEHPDPPGF